MKICTKTIQKAFDRKVIPYITCMGIDTASRTGWCTITTSATECRFDYGYIDMKGQDKYFKYKHYIEIFYQMLKPEYKVIIEETFYGRNVKTFQMLSRLGGFIYAIAHLIGVKDKDFMLATTARKNLGFKGNAKKQEIHKQFREKLDIGTDDEDIIDAFILALNGIIVKEKK